MMVISSIVSSGMQATRGKMDAHASNVANARTPGYRKLVATTAERADGGVDLDVRRADEMDRGVYGPDGRPETSEGTEEASRLDPREGESIDAGSVDLAEEMVGMGEAARTMEALAAVYERENAALGSLVDAFG